MSGQQPWGDRGDFADAVDGGGDLREDRLGLPDPAPTPVPAPDPAPAPGPAPLPTPDPGSTPDVPPTGPDQPSPVPDAPPPVPEPTSGLGSLGGRGGDDVSSLPDPDPPEPAPERGPDEVTAPNPAPGTEDDPQPRSTPEQPGPIAPSTRG